MYYFGEPWDDPQLLDARRCGTPVGARCKECLTPILPGEHGAIMTKVTPYPPHGYGIDVFSRHRECHLLARMREADGQCHHLLGCRTPQQRRESALALWERLRGS